MPRYEVEVTYRLRRKIIVNGKDPEAARMAAVEVVKKWQGPFEINAGTVEPVKAYEQTNSCFSTRAPHDPSG